MHIDNFGVWFNLNKVTSGKSEEMESLKKLFEDCWENSFQSSLENFNEDELNEEIENLENEIDELEDAIENLKGTIIEIKNEVEESKTLKEAKERVRDYDY